MSVIYQDFSKGDFIGAYQVLSLLGGGGFGATYHVQQNQEGKEFALKLIPISKERSLTWGKRLEAQSTLLTQLSSAYIDQILACGRVDDSLYVVKDFLSYGGEGSCPFHKFLEKFGGKLSSFQAYHFFKQSLRALCDANSFKDANHSGIIHGNLKSTNILFVEGENDAGFEVKLSDFQPYQLFDLEQLLHNKTIFQRKHRDLSTQQNQNSFENFLLAQSRAFDAASPEEVNGGKASEQSDLFSLGTLLYQALTGSIFVGGSIIKLEDKENSAFFEPFLQRLLSEDLSFRYHTAREVLEDVEEKIAPLFPPKEEEVVKKRSSLEGKRTLTPPGMVYIPKGEFFVGGGESGSDALPEHKKSTPGFYIDRHPVTNAQFARFVEDSHYETELEQEGAGPLWVQGEWVMHPGICWNNPKGFGLPLDFLQHPVVYVTYGDALAYAHWLGHRLPTEFEWEYAAKGGLKSARYPSGDELTKFHANFSSDGTTPVMEYSPNGYGLYDLAGNVWEWSISWYEAYAGNFEKNPHFGKEYRVVRGGAWMYDSFHCMLAFRNANMPTHAYPTLGFRTVWDFK